LGELQEARGFLSLERFACRKLSAFGTRGGAGEKETIGGSRKRVDSGTTGRKGFEGMPRDKGGGNISGAVV